MNIGRFYLLLATAILIFAPATSRGITLGQIDTFEGGTTQMWTNGINIVVLPNGLAGNNDHFLDVPSGTSGTSPRMQVFNQSQWTGNYLAAGVTGVEMDIRNPDSLLPALHIRIAIGENTSFFLQPLVPGYSSTTAFDLPADGLWHHAIFSLAPVNMTGINSPQPLASDLANVVSFSILSSALPATAGDFVTGGVMQVDNIAAVPEPSSVSILLSGIIGIALLRRHRVFFRAYIRSTHADGEFALS